MAYPSIRNIPLEWIRAFEAAARTGNFTAAAQEAGLTQAAVSQRIANLEAHIGTALFIRKARGVSLSVEGEAWLPYVSSALEGLEQSYEGLFGSERETITISASASVIQLWMVPRLQAWIERDRPQISFSTMIIPTEKQHQDAAVRIRYGSGNWPESYKVPLFDEALSPVMGPQFEANRMGWQDLPKIAVLGPRMSWQDWANQTGASATPVPRVRFDSFVSALQAAQAGAGVLLGSLPLCTSFLDDGRLLKPCKDVLQPPETYWMIGRKDAISRRHWEELVEVFT